MTEVWEEPARGGYPPDGFVELPGIDRARALVQGLIPRSPFMRLFGIRHTHASASTATLVMPASPWLQRGMPGLSVAGTVEILPLVSSALVSAASTTAPPGAAHSTEVLSVSYVRRPILDMESFVARARCIAAGASRATVEVHTEDAEGRLVVHATAQVVFGRSPLARRAATPPTLEPVAEPSFSTPDPPARALTDPDVGVPLWRLMGITIDDVGGGACTLTMPVNDWLLSWLRVITPGAIHAFLNNALQVAMMSVALPDQGVIEHDVHLVRTGDPSGVSLRGWDQFIARANIDKRGGDSLFATGDVTTGAGDKIWVGSSTATLVSRRDSASEVSPDRVLAAVLYTDIVGSTPHAERLGDARWKDVLEEFHTRSSRQVATLRGREVKWTGDGILATFDSPARAVQCARALREAAQRQQIEIRAGVHVGECELMGTDVAGIAVHVAQRVMDKAEPATIFVTSTVREAAAGSGLHFADRGRHQLKGIDGDWQLYAVED